MITRRGFLLLGAAFAAAMRLDGCETDDGIVLDSSITGTDLLSVLYRREVPEEQKVETIELTRNRHGRPVCKRMLDIEHGDFVQRETHEVYETDFDLLARIAAAYDLRGASEQPEAEVQEDDGSTERITFTYEDDAFAVSLSQDLSELQRDGFDAAYDALVELLSEG